MPRLCLFHNYLFEIVSVIVQIGSNGSPPPTDKGVQSLEIRSSGVGLYVNKGISHLFFFPFALSLLLSLSLTCHSIPLLIVSIDHSFVFCSLVIFLQIRPSRASAIHVSAKKSTIKIHFLHKNFAL